MPTSSLTLPVCAVLLSAWVFTSPTQFRQRLDLVTIDARVVNDRGESVTDLTAADFDVTVDGKPRKVVAFRSAAVEPRAGLSGASETPAERVVVLVFQRDHIRPQEGRDFFQAGAAFIDTLKPTDHVALWTIPTGSAELLMPRDRDALKETLRAMRGSAPPSYPLINVTEDEAVSIVYLRDAQTLTEAAERECARRSILDPSCAQEVRIEAQRRYDELRVRGIQTLQALELLIKLVSGFEGPKHIVFITAAGSQTPENADALQRVATAAVKARVHIHALEVPRNEGIDAENQSGPRARAWQNSSGYSLAATTGGMALTPSDPRVGFRRLNAELTGAYEFGIEAEPGDLDGKPHRIEVRVPSRLGLRVHARQMFLLSPAPAKTMTTPSVPPTPVAGANERAPRAPGEPVARALLARLGDYVERFEREFSTTVAEERYVQLIRPLRGTPSWPSDERALEWHDGDNYPRSGLIAQRRQLLSDVLLVSTPQGWLGYRDVAESDGGAVRNRGERVSRLFLSREASRTDQLRRISEESARYNIGGFKRTLNIPTLPLSFMHSRHHARFTFTAGGHEELDGVATDVIRYEEHHRPSLIGTREGVDVPASGRIWIDSTLGAVVRTEIHILIGGRRGTLVTNYRRDARFEVLIPDYMWEWYDAGAGHVGGSVITRVVVECLARYTNYRKFSVSTGSEIR